MWHRRSSGRAVGPSPRLCFPQPGAAALQVCQALAPCFAFQEVLFIDLCTRNEKPLLTAKSAKKRPECRTFPSLSLAPFVAFVVALLMERSIVSCPANSLNKSLAGPQVENASHGLEGLLRSLLTYCTYPGTRY